jgi:TetR/AcrR family transcriptional regulator, cholesterol catabolism regulator
MAQRRLASSEPNSPAPPHGDVHRRRNVTRKRILEVARRLFREEGYRGTSLDAVAAELGVTRAAIYHWVPSKETLLCEIHDEAMDLLVQGFTDVLRQNLSPVEKLAAVVRNHVLVVAANLDTIAVFFQDEASLPAGPARRIADRKRDYDHRLRELVRAAQADGSTRAVLDPVGVVESLLGMCNWLYHWYDPHGAITPQRLADQIVEIALGGVERR